MDPTLQSILDTGEQEGYTPVEMADAVKSWRNGSAKEIFGAADAPDIRITATRQLDAEAEAALKTLQGTEVRRHYDEAFGDAVDERKGFEAAFAKAGYEPGKLQIEGTPAKNWLGIAQGLRGITDSDIFDLPEAGRNATHGGSLMHGDVPVASYDTLHDGERPKAVIRFAGEELSPWELDRQIEAVQGQMSTQSKRLGSISITDLKGIYENQRAVDEYRDTLMRLKKERERAGTEPLTIDLPDFTKDDVQKRIADNKAEVAKKQKELADLGQIDMGRDPEGGPGEQYGVERQKKKVQQTIEEKLAENQRLSKEGIRYLQAETIRQEILKPENRKRIPDQGLMGDVRRGGAALAINTGTAALVAGAGLGSEWAEAKLPEQIEASAQLETVMPGAVPRHMEGGLANDILTSAAESLPTTAAILATGGASAALTSGTGALAPLVPMYVSSYGAKYANQIQQADALDEAGRSDEADEMRRLANVAAHVSAAIETGTEMISKGHAPFRAGVRGGLARAAATVVEEGPIEEGIAQIAQNVVEPLTSGGVNQPDALEGVPTAVGAGMISALPFGAAVAFRGDKGRAQQAIADYDSALQQEQDPKSPKLEPLRQRAEEAKAFLGANVDQRIETLGQTAAEALAQQAALNDPAANALIQTAEQVAQAPDTSLTVAALEQASGEAALQAALAEADRLKFGRPEETDATETAPVAETPPEAPVQESSPVTAAEVLPEEVNPSSEGIMPTVENKVAKGNRVRTKDDRRGEIVKEEGGNLTVEWADGTTSEVPESEVTRSTNTTSRTKNKVEIFWVSGTQVAITFHDSDGNATTVWQGAAREQTGGWEAEMNYARAKAAELAKRHGLAGYFEATAPGEQEKLVKTPQGRPAPTPAAPPVSEGATDADFAAAEREISAAAPSPTVQAQPAPAATEATPASQEVSGIPPAVSTVEAAEVQAAPEQMTPERFLAQRRGAVFDPQRSSGMEQRKALAAIELADPAAVQDEHTRLIRLAISGWGDPNAASIIDRGMPGNQPVSAAAVDAYGIELPEGYAKQGDLYVYQAPTPTVKDQVTTAAKPIVRAAEQRGQKQGAAMATFVELLAPAVEARAKNFTGVSFVKAAPDEAGASLNPKSGALEIDINRLASHVQSVAIGNRETMEAFLDEILREEVHHRGFVALYGTPDGKKAVDDVWTALPDKFKTESASAYFAARGGGKFKTDLQAKAEFFRQYGEKPEFAARVERYMADAGLLGKWRKLLEAFLASLEKLRTDPQFAALVKQIEGVQAGIRDALERIQGVETKVEPSPSPPIQVSEPEGKFSVYQAGERWLVQQGEKRGFGDHILDSREEAVASAAQQREMERANAEFRAKSEARAKEVADAQAAKEKPLNDYLDTLRLNSMQRGKLSALLSSGESRRSSSFGKDYTGNRFEVVRQMVADGYAAQTEEVDVIKELTGQQSNRMDNRGQEAHEKRRKAAGKKTEYRLAAPNDGGFFVVTKVEYDLARHFSSPSEETSLSTAPGPTDAELRQQLAEDAALLEGRSKTESEATAAEKEGPTQATQDERVYKDGEPVGPFYRAPLPDELRELTVQRMLDTSAMLSDGMGADYGKRVMAYLKGGADLPGIPHTIVFQQNLALSLKHDSALRDRLGLKEAETVAVVNPLISTLGTQAGRTLQAMSGGNLYGPLAELAEEVQAEPKKGLKEIGVDDEAKLADDIKEDVKTQRVEAAKKVAETVKQTNGHDLIGDVMELWPEAKRKTLAALKAKLQYLSALKARLAAFSLKSAPGPGSGNDVAYLAAVESGDMETAQRMVDEAAKKAGYTTGPVFHGTNYEHDTNPNGVGDSRNAGRPNDGQAGGEAKEGDRGLGHAQNRQVPSLTFPFQVFDPSRRGSETGRDPRFSGFHFTAYPNYAEQYGKNVGRFLLRVEEWGRDGWMESNFGNDLFDVAVRDPSQIKSADAVTRDAKGNVIPLSQRFNPESDSILYSVPGDPNYIAEDISEEELRKEIAKVMGEVDNLVHEISGKKKRKPKTPEQVEGDGQRMVDEMEEAQARATFHAWVAGAEQEGVASFEELMVNAIDPGGFNRDAFALSLSQKFKDVDPEFIDEVTNKIADAIEGKEEAAEADSEKPDYDGRAKRIVGSAIAEDSTTDYTPVIDPMTRAIKQRLKDEITATEFAERMEKLEVEPMTAFALNRKVEADIAKRKAEAFRRKTEADKKRETEKGERDATGEIDRLAKQLDDIEPAKKPGSELKKLTEAFKKFEIGETGLRDGLATLNVKPATANKLVQLLTLNRQRQALHTWTTIRQSVAKAREDAIKRAVTALKPAKPRDLPKRNKFVNTLIRALESGVLDSQHVRDAFAEAYELHGLTTERLEKLGAILLQTETLPDGMVRQTLRKQAFSILNEIAPASRTMSALYQNLMGGVLGGVSTITAQFSGLSRVLNPFQGAWQFMAMAGGNPVTNPATFFKIWGQYMKQAWNTSSMMRAGVEGTLSTGSLGLGVSPSSLVNVQPNEMHIASLSPSELYKMRIGRRGLIKGLLGTVPESPLRRNVKSAVLFPSWLASRSFNLIGSAEAWSGAIDQNMAFEAILMKKLMDDGMPTQKAWNKVRDLMSPKTSAVMWQEAMAQAAKESESKLVSKHALRQRAEEIVQDKLDEEHKVKLRNRNREVGAWLNFKSDPLTAVGSWFSLDVMAKAPTPVKMIFLFSRFFSNVIERAIFNSPLGFINMSKESAEKGALNPRQKRIEAIFGSLEQYRQYRNGLATSSVMSTFVMGTAMALAWGLWRWLDEDEEGLPPPFWLTGATPPSSPYAAGRQLSSAGWWAPSSFFLRIPGTKAGIALNYVQANPELAITLSAIGNIADRIMFPEMLTYSTDQRTGERTKSAFKTYVQPLVNAVAAPATRSTYATFSQAVQRALEGNVQSLTKLLGRPIGETATATVLGGPIVRDIAKLTKPDVPKASQDAKQAFLSGIPFADVAGLDTGLPMLNQFGERIEKYPYFPFVSAQQNSSPEVQRAAKILNDSGITKEGPQEWMIGPDVVELAGGDGKRYLLSLDERAEVLGEIGRRFAEGVNAKETKIRATEDFPEKKKIVEKVMEDSRKSVLRRWRNRVAPK